MADEPIAVDPAYQLSDNQFWYSKSRIAEHVQNSRRITVRIEGLGIRTLDHAALGKDGRVTKSFTLATRSDRDWWKSFRGRLVRIELLAVDGEAILANTPPPVAINLSEPFVRPAMEAPKPRAWCTSGSSESLLCIGLDIAWFGGSAKNPESQYDCLAAVRMAQTSGAESSNECLFRRIKLENRDSSGKQIIEGVAELLRANGNTGKVVLALDAPVQAAPRPHLPVRSGLSSPGTMERRACENYLSVHRQRLDKVVRRGVGWHPTIQPGAPLAPRVANVLEGLSQLGFQLWTHDRQDTNRLVIECFPAEAVWAAKHLGHYPDTMLVTQAKAYKDKARSRLSAEEVSNVFHNVLDAFAVPSGDARMWGTVLNAGLSWLLADPSWKSDAFYRGGKLLDDAVDSMICLATALSYVHGHSHTWQDPHRTNDGHIIGPGVL